MSNLATTFVTWLQAAAASAPATARAAGPDVSPAAGAVLNLLVLGITVLSPILAWRCGIFRRGSVHGPNRFQSGDRVSFFFGGMLMAFGVWLIGSNLVLQALRAWTALTTEQSALVAGGLAYAIAFPVILMINAAWRDDGLRLLGVTREQAVSGVLPGLAGMLIVLPWLWWLAIIAELILSHYHITAPTEHAIFQVWRKQPPPVAYRIFAVLSAVVFAPLAEEAMFRGMLQTGLSQFLARTLFRAGSQPVGDGPQPPAFPVMAGPVPETAAPPGEPQPVIPVPGPRPPVALDPSPGARWAAILVTAALFAVLHQPWLSSILIFILAVGLGYVYERTGSLWSSIFMHMFFNGFEMALFLLVLSH